MALFAVLPIAFCLALAVSATMPALGGLRRYAGVAASAVVLVSGLVLVAAVLDGQTPTAGWAASCGSTHCPPSC